MSRVNTMHQWKERLRDRARTASFGRFLWRRFLDDRLFQAAASLAYTTVFALVPLAELAPEAIIPGHGTVRHALQGIDGCGLEPIG